MLAQAEIAMLESYVAKADLKDGQKVLNLGCGWGRLSLYFAERFPGMRVTGSSNSRTAEGVYHVSGQVERTFEPRGHHGRCSRLGIRQRSLRPSRQHRALRAHEEIPATDGQGCPRSCGKLFVQIFAHKDTSYGFDGG